MYKKSVACARGGGGAVGCQLELLTCHVLTVCNQIKVLHACLLL